MPDEAAFLQHIAEFPNDDAPRLVFADWLDDHGRHARAEFIRVQCALAACGPGDDDRVGLELRSWELLRSHRDAWLADVPKAFRKEDTWFERGFVAGVRMTAAEFLRSAERLAGSTLVRHADITRWQAGTPARFTACARLALLRTLAVGNPAEHAPTILAAPGLTGLRGLRIAVRAAAPGLFAGVPALQTLDLTLTMPDPGRLGHPHAWPTGLRDLTVRGAGPLEADELAGLLAAPFAVGLTSFRPVRLPPDGLALLGETTNLAGLRSLTVWGWMGEAGGMRRVFASPRFPSLAALMVVYPDPGWIPAFLEGPLPVGLRELSVFGGSDSDVAALATSPRLTGLRRLRLSSHKVTERSVAALAASPYFPELLHLDLQQNLRASAPDVLHASPHLPSLRAVTFLTHERLAEPAVLRARSEPGWRFAVLG